MAKKTPEEILASMDQDMKNAPRIPRWQPEEDNTYTDVIESLITFASSGGDDVTVILVGRIMDGGPYEGKLHVIGRFSRRNIGMLRDCYEILGGSQDETSVPAMVKYLGTKQGQPVLVTVKTSVSSKNGQTYHNANITGVVESKEEAPDEGEPDAGADDGVDGED